MTRRLFLQVPFEGGKFLLQTPETLFRDVAAEEVEPKRLARGYGHVPLRLAQTLPIGILRGLQR